MRSTVVLCVLFIGVGLFAADEPARPPKGTECGESVLAFYEEGPNFANVMQVYPEHAKFITEVLKQGKFAAAGKMKEGSKALILLRTKDMAEAQALVNQDPFVQKGVVKASYMTWNHCWAPGTPAPDFAAATDK